MLAIEYFKQLTKIPRPSGKEDKVVEFLVDYAKKNNYHYEINGIKNVIIKKNNKSQKNIILQAHTDMVCEKLGNIDIDFDKDPIQTIIDGDIIRANGTTLGADDGYGVCTILQILDECGEGYPNIEAIFTSDEEVGMSGAMSLDLSGLKSKMIIGLDGTSSSEITTSSAGGLRLQFDSDAEYETVDLDGFEINVFGLLGGHSGEEINLNRANSNKLLGEFLHSLDGVKIASFEGGNKDNAIPRESNCVFYTTDDLVINKFNLFIEKIKMQYKNETQMELTIKEVKINRLMNEDSSNKLINFICDFENAVLVWDTIDSTFPITSINLAKVSTQNNIMIRSMLRSSVSQYEKDYIEKYKALAYKYNFTMTLANRSPYFEKSKDGKLVDACVKAYENLGYTDLKVGGIHAGLEGGVFAEKIPGAEIVCLGADLKGIHTPDECMKISSLEKLVRWIKEILNNI